MCFTSCSRTDSESRKGDEHPAKMGTSASSPRLICFATSTLTVCTLTSTLGLYGADALGNILVLPEGKSLKLQRVYRQLGRAHKDTHKVR